MIGCEEIVSGCSRGGLDLLLRRISQWGGWPGLGIHCQGIVGVCEHLTNVWTWH